MSNMSTAALTSLVTGKYHIGSVKGSNRWYVRYYAPDGKTHFCGSESGTHREWKMEMYVSRTPFGIAGIFHSDRELSLTRRHNKGWPFIADSDRGLLFWYRLINNQWVAQPGWVQEEYAAVFAKRCPKLPRVAKVNNNQSGGTFSDLMREATPVRGFKTAFKNNPEDPFTASMYYWSYPPQ